MHHGEKLSEQMRDEAARLRLGATGDFPEGRADETDEGAIEFGVSHNVERARVFMNFGKPVAWLALTLVQAEQLGELLMRQARECREKWVEQEVAADALAADD